MAEPTYDQAITALRAADAAGNAEEARQLAIIAQRLQPAQQTSKPSDLISQALAKKGLSEPSQLFMNFGRTAGASDKTISGMAYQAGGKVTDIGAKLGLPPEVSAAGGTLANLGVEYAAGQGVGALAAPGMKFTARDLMNRAIKPPVEMRGTPNAAKAVETALQKELSPTESSMDKVKLAVRDLETKLQDVLTKSSATVDPNSVAAKTLARSIAEATWSPDPKLAKRYIDKSINTFLAHPEVQGKEVLSVADANKLKQGIYAALEGTKGNPFVEANKTLKTGVMAEKLRASVLREEIATAEPKVVPTLKEQSELLNFLDAAQAEAYRSGKQNYTGLGAISPHLVNAAIWMADRYPWVKARLAHLLYKGSNQIPAGATMYLTGQEQKKLKE